MKNLSEKMQKLDSLITLEQVYSRLLTVRNVNIICSKPYGFEFMILIYNFTKNNSEYGVEETFEMINHNRCKRPAFLSFIKDLENDEIIHRLKSKLKKSRTLLRLNKDIVHILDQFNNLT